MKRTMRHETLDCKNTIGGWTPFQKLVIIDIILIQKAAVSSKVKFFETREKKSLETRKKKEENELLGLNLGFNHREHLFFFENMAASPLHALDLPITLLNNLVGQVVLVTIKAKAMVAGQSEGLYLLLCHVTYLAGKFLHLFDSFSEEEEEEEGEEEEEEEDMRKGRKGEREKRKNRETQAPKKCRT